jgi:hypothetical protein
VFASLAGDLIETWHASDAELAELQRVDPDGSWVAALRHERVPFVSYPYEWTFSMLQDAALLQLRLTAAALDGGLMLKDATPYNVQWRGSRPVFIDVTSFERSRPGEPWPGYRQFCMLFLYPLLLEAYRGIAFQAWLRGSPNGFAPGDFRALFSRRDVFQSGMLRHVFLHARLERDNARRGSEVRTDLAEAGFDNRLIRANVDQLTRLVGRLRSGLRSSAWDHYRSSCSYVDADAARKEDFVRRAVGRRRRRLTWDLGCNDGRYSLIAADDSDLTLALDSDPSVVDALYRSRRAEGDEKVLPLVVDLSNPSPGLGWRNGERSTLIERGRPDMTLCLALVHHLSISNNIPLREVVAWLRSLDSDLVVEFPDRDDKMVDELLRAKGAESHPDYRRETFEALLLDSFEIIDSAELESGTRTLYDARPR